MTPGTRGVGTLSRNLRSRWSAPTIYAIRSKRWMAIAADSKSLSQHDGLPASMIIPSQLEPANNKQSTINEVEDNSDEIRPPRAVQVAYLRPLKRTAEHRIPACNLQLRSYSVRNLEFFTTFALRAAYFLNLPAVGPVPLPKLVERWTVPRGHFVHKKSQENFERITLRRLIQIQDGHPETVQIWLAYLRKRSYYGVGMKANVWSFEKLGLGKEMDILADRGESLEQRWTSQFPSKITPEVQAEVDAWMQKHGSESGETVPLKNLEDGSSEKNYASVTTQIDEILAQVEQEAAAAVSQNSPEPSNPIRTAGSANEAKESFASLDQGPNATQTSQNQQTVNESISSLESPMMEEVAADLASTPETSISQETSTIPESEPATINSMSTQRSQIPQEMKAVEQPSMDPTNSVSVASEGVTTENTLPLESEHSTLATQQQASSLSAETESAPDSVETASSPAPEPVEKSTAQKASKNTTKHSTETSSSSASQSEETKAPHPSDVDTAKDVSTPEEADPSIKPQNEKAKESESEDAQQPLGNMPKTPS